MSSGSFHLDIEGHGLSVLLGPTEAKLMELAWANESLTVKSALYQMGDEGHRAYTTVMTVLNRLTDKRLLTRSRDGRNYIYRAASDRAAFVQERVDRIMTCLKQNFPEACGRVLL